MASTLLSGAISSLAWSARSCRVCSFSAEVHSLLFSTRHFQGFFQLWRKQGRCNAARLVGQGAHLEERRGSLAQAVEYCLKEEGRLDGPWQFGFPGARGLRGGSGLSVILSAVKSGASLQEAAELDPASYVRAYRGIATYQALVCPAPSWREVRAFFLEGKSGCGKSSLVYDVFGANAVYTLAKQAPLWFNGYSGQRVLFIDEYQGLIVREELLRLLDGHCYSAEVKGSFTAARWDCVVLASNFEFGLWGDDAVRRRFERGGYFRLSGERGQYPVLGHFLATGERVGELDGRVTQVPFLAPKQTLPGHAWNFQPPW